MFKQFCNSSLWRSGPSWLTQSSKYPSQQVVDTDVNELLIEPVAAEPFVPCLDVSKYSSLRKVIGIFHIVLIYIQSFSKKIEIKSSPLHLLVKLAQQEQYPTVFHYLRTADWNNVSADVINFVNQLGFHLDANGMIRSGGRLKNARVSENRKQPILLPPKSALSTLIMEQCHRSNHHAGVNTMLVKLREDFWLPKAKQQIKKVVHSCILCKKLLRSPLVLPTAPPFPPERVTFSRPFQCVGVDMTGSYDVYERDPDEQVSSCAKAYICLFT